MKIDDKNLKIQIIFCLIMSILITVIHNLSINFYAKNIIIPLIIMVSGYLILIRKNKLEVNKKAYYFLIPIVLILLSDFIINIDFTNKMLNVFILPVIISVFFFLLTNKNYEITRESLFSIFKLFPANVLKNLKCIKNLFSSIKNVKSKLTLNIFIGLLIGTPIAVVLLYLLANADRYFNIFIEFILNGISKVIISSSVIPNLIILFISFIILFSVFLNILKNKNMKLKKQKNYNINNVVTSTILILVNSIFVLFLLSEISRLTVNFLQLPIEYTYAQYAREGFFQLLLVTSINFAIILYYIYYTKVIKENSFIKKMILLLIAFSIILIFNSYYRMILYIGAYGFTILRLQVILFLAMELILFIILIKKIISKLKNKDGLLFTIVLLLFYILNVYLCTNAFLKLLNQFLKLFIDFGTN